MIKRYLSLAVVCLLFSLAVPAQEGAQMMLIYDEVVKPGHISEYVESSKKFFEILGAQEEDMEWLASMTDDFHFLYAIPIENHGAIDAMHQSMQKMMMSIGPEEFVKWMEESGKSVDHTNSMVVLRRNDLSYHPETMIAQEEIRVLEYNFYDLKPGTEFAVEQLAKDFASTMKSKGIEAGYTFYQLILGEGMPRIAVVVPARSPEHLAQLNTGFQEKMGEEGMALEQRLMSLIRGFDRKIGFARPDLSSSAFMKKAD